MKRPTIRDVAFRAGVSHQTVSRVINGDPRVASATRERVLTEIRALDYVPNAVARSLTSDRTHTLGVVTANVADYAFGQTIAGAETEARRHGFLLVIGSVEGADDEADRQAYLQLLLQRRVEGLMLDWPTLGSRDGTNLSAVAARVPLILVAARADIPGVQTVDVDNRGGGRDATAHLIEHGHRAVATITGPLTWSTARARLDGYWDALRDAHLAEDPSLVESCPDWGPSSGQVATAQLLGGGSVFTAIFAQSDLLAAGAITELRSRGIRVPADVSIIGFDDIPVARFVDPPLTTMRQPIRELGALTARTLIDAIGRSGSASLSGRDPQLLATRLVVRGSVGRLVGA